MKITFFRLVIFLLSLVTLHLSLPTPAYAQAPVAWSGQCVAEGDIATIQGFECLVYNLLQVIFSLAGIVFFVVFLSNSFKYLTAGGNEKAAAAARTGLTYSLFAVVGIIAAWFILRLVGNITGADVLNFQIPK